MTHITSKTNRSRKLHFRCGFFSIDYRDEKRIVNVKTKESENEKNVKIDSKSEIKKIEKIVNRNRKLEKKDMKIDSRKIDRNCKCNKKKVRIDKMKIGIKIVKEIVLIGSALMGLLPSLKYRVVREIII